MSAIRNPAPGLLWRSRLRLASLALLVMGLILYGAGFTMARLLLQEQEAALRRELQTVAGTLHDSLKLSLPPTATASAALSAVLPGLCLVDLPCPMPDALIERHAISATDPARFQLRIFSPVGRLLAASPAASGPAWAGPGAMWQERRLPGGERRLSYTIHLHQSSAPGPWHQPAELGVPADQPQPGIPRCRRQTAVVVGPWCVRPGDGRNGCGQLVAGRSGHGPTAGGLSPPGTVQRRCGP